MGRPGPAPGWHGHNIGSWLQVPPSYSAHHPTNPGLLSAQRRHLSGKRRTKVAPNGGGGLQAAVRAVSFKLRLNHTAMADRYTSTQRSIHSTSIINRVLQFAHFGGNVFPPLHVKHQSVHCKVVGLPISMHVVHVIHRYLGAAIAV